MSGVFRHAAEPAGVTAFPLLPPKKRHFAGAGGQAGALRV